MPLPALVRKLSLPRKPSLPRLKARKNKNSSPKAASSPRQLTAAYMAELNAGFDRDGATLQDFSRNSTETGLSTEDAAPEPTQELAYQNATDTDASTEDVEPDPEPEQPTSAATAESVPVLITANHDELTEVVEVAASQLESSTVEEDSEIEVINAVTEFEAEMAKLMDAAEIKFVAKVAESDAPTVENELPLSCFRLPTSEASEAELASNLAEKRRSIRSIERRIVNAKARSSARPLLPAFIAYVLIFYAMICCCASFVAGGDRALPVAPVMPAPPRKICIAKLCIPVHL